MCPTSRHVTTTTTATAAAFSVLDANKDGNICLSDLKSIFPGDDDAISSMITLADSDHNGVVNLEEFERVLPLSNAGGARGDSGLMEEVFRVMDRDGDGRVGLEDLKMCLGWAGVTVGDEEVKGMIRMSGGDESEGVGFDGFVKIMAVDFVF